LSWALAAFRAFEQFFLDSLAFQLGDVIDEELALEVIHLVLNTDCKQALSLELDCLPLSVQCSDADALSPFHRFIEIRHRETAFVRGCQTVRFENLRVDQTTRCIALV
jgi:hypothetical protein